MLLRVVRPFVASGLASDVKGNVAHPSAIGLHWAGKVRRYTNKTPPPFNSLPRSGREDGKKSLSLDEGRGRVRVRLFGVPRFSCLVSSTNSTNSTNSCPTQLFPFALFCPLNQSTNQPINSPFLDSRLVPRA